MADPKPEFDQIIEPQREGPIEAVWAVLDPGSTGDGLVAIIAGNGMTLPLLTTRERNVRFLEAEARVLSANLGRPLVLAKFTNREDLKTIGGQ